ncbi:MAG TPA: hypothetical protein VE569_04570, partial [Acidimicrobiia bacterium]|nr:hypothetical protein [Acidimicrobiia bacterium]
EDGTTRGELIADAEALDPSAEAETSILVDAVRHGFDQLPEVNRRVVALRFGLDRDSPLAIGAISKAVGLPDSEVCQIISQSIEMLAPLLAVVEDMRAA